MSAMGESTNDTVALLGLFVDLGVGIAVFGVLAGVVGFVWKCAM
jgi:hypothetical protein